MEGRRLCFGRLTGGFGPLSGAGVRLEVSFLLQTRSLFLSTLFDDAPFARKKEDGIIKQVGELHLWICIVYVPP